MEKTREVVAGKALTQDQMKKELKRLNKQALKDLGLGPNVPPGAGLMLKTSLSLPWNKLRELRR